MMLPRAMLGCIPFCDCYGFLCFFYAAFAVPSFTPPVHLLFFLSHETVPKLVVRKMFAFSDDSLSHLLDRASISLAEGNVFPTTPERGFCTF